MKTTRFSIGGYNFNDWSLVKELYVPEDISSSTDKSLHVRGREDLPLHLRPYVIPYNKKFIVFAVGNAKMSTAEGIGLFGTGKAYGRYPVSHQQSGEDTGAPIAWSDDEYLHYGDPTPKWYYCCETYGTLVLHDGKVYECALTHWPSQTEDPAKEPDPSQDTTYWKRGSDWDMEWKVNTFYFFNELEMATFEGVAGAYMCMVDHTSSLDTKPCSGKDWLYQVWPGGTKIDDGIWNPGDEFQADLSSQFGFSEECLRVSKGTSKPFSYDIIAVFERNVENRLRRIDAMTTGGTMKAGATLYGIEVDA